MIELLAGGTLEDGLQHGAVPASATRSRVVFGVSVPVVASRRLAARRRRCLLLRRRG